MSLWSKTKNAVYGFVTGAAKSIPMTILYATAACGISAALGSYVNPEMDFLHILDKSGGIDVGKIALRAAGSAIIGATISGTVEGYTAATGHETQTPATGGVAHNKSQSPAKVASAGMNMNDVSPPLFTPQSASSERART